METSKVEEFEAKKRDFAELTAGEIIPIHEPAKISPRRDSCSPLVRVAQKPHTKTRDELAAGAILRNF